ncbi:MAG TPA: PQQ-binding-like beta-propeller repeat protein, partial [Fimbriimonadaceae bacterium]|nr:PQQ-binding-like beta-propeller repeat protein [Fimbriimonadaceae bacterium]
NEAYAYIGYTTASLYAVNRVSGVIDFQIPDTNYAGGYESGAVTLSGGSGYVISGNRLIAFDIPHRTIGWQVADAFQGQPVVVGDTVYAIDGSSFRAVSAGNGALRWSWPSPSGSLSGTIIVTNNVAFVGDPTTTYAIDLSTHALVWSIPVAGQMAVIDGRLYIGDSKGTLTCVDLAPVPQLAGSVSLGDFGGQVAGRQVSVEVRNPGSTVPLDSYVVALDAAGHYSVNTGRVGTFDVAFRSSHWLRKVVKNVVFSGRGPVDPGGASASATLINGDINGDNSVSLADFAELKIAYGTSVGIPNWNPNADLNGDGGVGLADFGILKSHYGEQGDR